MREDLAKDCRSARYEKHVIYFSITGRKLQVKEDLLVIQTLAAHAGIGEKLVFEQYGGKDNLRNYLRLLKARHEYVRGEYSRILVTRDAMRISTVLGMQ